MFKTHLPCRRRRRAGPASLQLDADNRKDALTRRKRGDFVVAVSDSKQ